MDVATVGEPHAVDTLFANRKVGDLARLARPTDVVHDDAGSFRLAGADALLVLDQQIAGELDLVGVGVGGCWELLKQAGVARIGDVDDRHADAGHVADVEGVAVAHDLAAIAVAAEIAVPQ
jgi:hypothetical protein